MSSTFLFHLRRVGGKLFKERHVAVFFCVLRVSRVIGVERLLREMRNPLFGKKVVKVVPPLFMVLAGGWSHTTTHLLPLTNGRVVRVVWVVRVVLVVRVRI